MCEMPPLTIFDNSDTGVPLLQWPHCRIGSALSPSAKIPQIPASDKTDTALVARVSLVVPVRVLEPMAIKSDNAGNGRLDMN
jgi:hypothetical protein